MAWSDSAAPKFNYTSRKLRDLPGISISVDITDVGVSMRIGKQDPATKEWSFHVWTKSDGVTEQSPFNAAELVALEAAFRPLIDAVFALNGVTGADD